MNSKILSILLLLLASPVLANDQRDSKIQDYAPVDKLGIVVYNNTSDNRQKLGYLLLDINGKPALYPAFKKGAPASSNQLSQLRFADLKKDWNTKTDSKNTESIQVSGWNSENRHWETSKIKLKFKDEYCAFFKVEGGNVKVTEWLLANQLPKTLNFSRLAKSARPVPVEIMCVDGPEEVINCGPQDQ